MVLEKNTCVGAQDSPEETPTHTYTNRSYREIHVLVTLGPCSTKWSIIVQISFNNISLTTLREFTLRQFIDVRHDFIVEKPW